MGLSKQYPLLSGAVPTIQQQQIQQQQILVTHKSGLSKMKAANNRKWLTVPVKGLDLEQELLVNHLNCYSSQHR